MPEIQFDMVLNQASGLPFVDSDQLRRSALLKAGALQSAILNSANFSIIATDETGIIQLFNIGAERMLGYMADEVVNRISPSDIHDPAEVAERARALTLELGTARMAAAFRQSFPSRHCAMTTMS